MLSTTCVLLTILVSSVSLVVLIQFIHDLTIEAKIVYYVGAGIAFCVSLFLLSRPQSPYGDLEAGYQ